MISSGSIGANSIGATMRASERRRLIVGGNLLRRGLHPHSLGTTLIVGQAEGNNVIHVTGVRVSRLPRHSELWIPHRVFHTDGHDNVCATDIIAHVIETPDRNYIHYIKAARALGVGFNVSGKYLGVLAAHWTVNVLNILKPQRASA